MISGSIGTPLRAILITSQNELFLKIRRNPQQADRWGKGSSVLACTISRTKPRGKLAVATRGEVQKSPNKLQICVR